jgi:flagellar basal body-associated protein FliL
VYRPHVALPSPFQLGRHAPRGAPKPQRSIKRWIFMLFLLIVTLLMLSIYLVPSTSILSSASSTTTSMIITGIVLFVPLFGIMMKTGGKRFTNQPRFRAFNALAAQQHFDTPHLNGNGNARKSE